MDGATLRRLARRPPLVGVGVGLVALLAFLLPAMLPGGLREPATGLPTLPQEIARYSWFTSPLTPGVLRTATMTYTNGLGVEFMDYPQSVVLGSDGSTYRRLDAVEAAGDPADQGDPTASVLSPDGSFLVFADSSGGGGVQVMTLADQGIRRVPTGTHGFALPVSIGADGRTVLLLTSKESLSRYADRWLRRYGRLARLDLATGDIRDYDLSGLDGAALSTDGRRIAAATGAGIVLVDAATGAVGDLVSAGPRWLDGDAWSPGGTRLVVQAEEGIEVIDLSAGRPVASPLPLDGADYGAAVGWKDDDTLLVHVLTDGRSNDSALWQVDLRTGAHREVTGYAVDGFTGAALVSMDLARNLVANLEVAEVIPDRGPLAPGWAVLAALWWGLVAFGVAHGVVRWEAGRRVPVAQ